MSTARRNRIVTETECYVISMCWWRRRKCRASFSNYTFYKTSVTKKDANTFECLIRESMPIFHYINQHTRLTLDT